MINVIEYSRESFESQFVPIIDTAYTDAQKYLDQLPKTIDIAFTDNGSSDMTGVGGFTVSDKQINIAVLAEFEDRELQRKNLYSTVMHEAFHVQQGFSYDVSPFTATEAAIYEGCAVIFERQYAHNQAIYGEYSDCSEQDLEKWFAELDTVGTKYFEDIDTWHKWAFYHPEYDQKWIIYKTGSWLVDRILTRSNRDVLDLKSKSAAEILKLEEVL